MDRVRGVCSAALSLRDTHRLRTRLPLPSLTIAGERVNSLEPYVDLIRDEVNVKTVRLSDDVTQFGTFQLQVNARAVGQKLGQQMKAVMTASKDGSWKALPDGSVEVGPATLLPGEFSLRLQSKDGVVSQTLPGNDAVVVLDIETTPELEREGLARDLIRFVQQSRKEAALHVADHIRLTLDTTADTAESLRPYVPYICEQTLADELNFGDPTDDSHIAEATLEGNPVRIGLTRVIRTG